MMIMNLEIKNKANKNYNYNVSQKRKSFNDNNNKPKNDDFEDEEYDDKDKNKGGEKLIEEMRADIIEKSNIIKKLGNDLKEKQNLPSQSEFNMLHYDNEKIANELEEKTLLIKSQEEEIKSLKNKLENMFDLNKNLKNAIKKKMMN